MFTDERRCKVWEQIRQHDLRAFARFLPMAVFSEAALRAGLRLGRSALALPTLAILGLAAALHRAKSFAEVLVLTVKLLEDGEHWNSSPRRRPNTMLNAPRNDLARPNDPSTIPAAATRPW